jgi:hypothetical protein
MEKIKTKEIDTIHWKKLKGTERDVFRQADWFRLALIHFCEEGGRGTSRQLAISLGFSEAATCNMRKGTRTADLKTAFRIALFFGLPLHEFLMLGRDLSDGLYAKRVKKGNLR